MATRRANKRPELKLLKGSFQTVEDTVSTILNEIDEKIKELEKALEARNGKVMELETALVKPRQDIALKNTIHKEEINTLKGECQDSARQQKILTAKIHLFEKANEQTEKLLSQLENRKRKWEAVKQLMDGDDDDNNHELSGKERSLKPQSKRNDLLIMGLGELEAVTRDNTKGDGREEEWHVVDKNGKRYKPDFAVYFPFCVLDYELTLL